MPDKTEETHFHLGDGVCASLEDGMIKLRVDRLEEGRHFIYLEPETYAALRAYARKIGFPGEEPK